MRTLRDQLRAGGEGAIVAASKLLPRWIPVGERLPEEGVDVLAFLPQQSGVQGGVHVARLSSLRTLKGTFSTCFGFGYLATHWMPLPEPPEADQ